VFSDKSGQSNGRILLNPARGDQCWDVLFMICGGTGLTPMLQLVSEFKTSFFLPVIIMPNSQNERLFYRFNIILIVQIISNQNLNYI